MTKNKLLLTGASGYIGGTLLHKLHTTKDLPPYDLYCLVRTKEQEEAVKRYGATPIWIDLDNKQEVEEAILSKKINIVFYLVNVEACSHQPHLIEALGRLKKQTGQEVYFLHTSGAKVFSSFAGNDEQLYDDDPDIYEKQESWKTPPEWGSMPAEGKEANRIVTQEAAAHDVKSFILAPCAVYGRGEGFGKKVTFQTVAIVKAGIACRRVYKVDEGRPIWPVCHVSDTAALYLSILQAILRGEDPPHGKKGYYLASPGSIRWPDLYEAIAKVLLKKGLVDTDEVVLAGDREKEDMGKALDCPPDLVHLVLGGQCLFEARQGRKIGWQPQYPAEYIIERAADEVDLILEQT